ncbi:hypothetical protein RRG08_066163, partial [Elysia crispata]
RRQRYPKSVLKEGGGSCRSAALIVSEDLRQVTDVPEILIMQETENEPLSSLQRFV